MDRKGVAVQPSRLSIEAGPTDLDNHDRYIERVHNPTAPYGAQPPHKYVDAPRTRLEVGLC